MSKKVLDATVESSSSFYIEPEIEDTAKDISFDPFKRMYGAVLERAILDLNNHEFFSSAHEWFTVEESADPDVMSFQFVCDVLDLDFSITRAKVNGLLTKKLQEAAI